MNTQEFQQLTHISKLPPWEVTVNLREYLTRVTVKEESTNKEVTRTGSQNNSMHLWFTQIAEECRNAGIDGKLLMSKTISVEVNMDIIKGMWKALQTALYGKTSTTELKKTGEIDTMINHFVRYFGEQHNLEIPPFPSDDTKTLEQNQGYKTGGHRGMEYPDDYQEPTI